MVQALRSAPAVVLLLVVIAITLFIGLSVLDTIKGTQDTESGVQTITNESFTASENIFVSLSTPDIVNGTETVFNGTFGNVSRNTHYFMNYLSGTINVSSPDMDGVVLNITYDHNAVIHSASFNATQDGERGLLDFSSFQSTLAVVAVAIIIIALLLGGFMAMSMMSRP